MLRKPLLRSFVLMALLSSNSNGQLVHSTTNLSSPRADLSGAELNGKAFFASGYYYTDLVEVYDPQSDSWSTTQMPDRRYNSGVVSARGRLFVAGGESSSNGHQDTVYIYDPANNTWSQDQLSLARSGLAAVHIDNKLMFAGGWNGSGASRSVIDIHDLDADTWSTASLTSPGGNTLGAVAGDTALFYSNAVGIVDMYDASNDQWTSTTITGFRDEMGVIGVGNLAFFAGGWEHDQPSGTTDIVDIYDAATDTWSVAHLSVPRGQIGVAAVGDYVMFAGGLTWENATLGMSDVVDIYNMQTGQWSVMHLSMPTKQLSGVGLEDQALFAGVVTTLQGERTTQVEVFTIPETSTVTLAALGLLGLIGFARFDDPMM